MSCAESFPSSISLDGTWEFVPGGRSGPVSSIEVPSLWEAAGHVELDGEAWYRRNFDLPDTEGRWTLRFGAVMDDAEVFVNGVLIGEHRGGFTPFAFDVTTALRAGTNLLEVRVWDIEASDPRHTRSMHGKQGWMLGVFPSPPSMYTTYGGIWQPVTLQRHGEIRIDDVWTNSDPGDLSVELELRGGQDVAAEVELELLGQTITRSIHLEAGTASLQVDLGRVDAAHWSPDRPVLHDLQVAVRVDGRLSDRHASRFGLRIVGFTRDGLTIDGAVVKIKSALVQGFRADTLYAEGSREAITAEVLAAKDAGLNMLRLHIKAFDPRYIDVCDEIGMLLHCDIPVAEPIAHHELGYSGPLADAAAGVAEAQVRRDRGHPSIVLWSAMNELGAEALASRKTPAYEGFARRLYEIVKRTDPTRPVIENDWIEPDPDEVFNSPVLTAHWYGRLSTEYLITLGEKTRRWASGGRPLFISEFGDWGLPRLDASGTEFWAYGASLTQAIDETAWSGPIDAFVEGTQRYQGIADRLQIEIFRSTPGVVGWCVTELTDVPQEFNGLLDIDRNPKPAAITEIQLASQLVLPIIRRTSWTAEAGSALTETVTVVNDGAEIADCRLRVRLGPEEIEVEVGCVAAGASGTAVASIDAPAEPGGHSIELTVLADGRPLAHNSYQLHVVSDPAPLGPITAVAGEAFERVLVGLGAELSSDPDAVLVIGEGSLDARTGPLAGERLRAGGDVVVFAQPASAAAHLPTAAAMADLATEWGSIPFLFTTSAAKLAALPPQSVLTTEILEVTPTAVWTVLGEPGASVETSVGVFKPNPGQITGMAVGRLGIHGGTLTVCQLPVMDAAAAGSAVARAVVADVVQYARAPWR
jgi:hypothetical protein